MFAHKSTMKSRINIKIGRKVFRVNGEILHQLHGQKVKVTRPLWVAVQVTTCRGWRHIVSASVQVTKTLVHAND